MTEAALRRMRSRWIKPEPRPALGNYYRWPDSAAFDRLREKGHRLISLPQLTRFLMGRI
ncbi:MAG: hypothetical protein OSB42_02485 [Planctomycetota bacterium]|nr:hypothetical protein [Planctomycetota bacterium]